jgi:hypothetical protein
MDDLMGRPTGFLSLSQELRDEVYGHIFRTEELSITEPFQLEAFTKVFLLNKQIYSETHALFYAKYYQKLVFTFTSVDKLLSMARSIGWHHPEFKGRLQLHHIHSSNFIDPAPPSIYHTWSAMSSIMSYLSIGIWRPNSDDGDGCLEKFKDNPFIVYTDKFFRKGSSGDMESVPSEIVTGGGDDSEVKTGPFWMWNKGPKWSVSVKYAYIEEDHYRGMPIGHALEICGDLGRSLRRISNTLFEKRRNGDKRFKD